MPITFEEFKRKELKKSEVWAEYNALEAEFFLIQTMIDARRKTGLTQKQLAERTGISQRDISKFETRGAIDAKEEERKYKDLLKQQWN